jgi:hypothetical protein
MQRLPVTTVWPVLGRGRADVAGAHWADLTRGPGKRGTACFASRLVRRKLLRLGNLSRGEQVPAMQARVWASFDIEWAGFGQRTVLT